MTSESAQKQLESLLRDIATTRASLPALLRSFQTPSLSSAELAQLYSARSQAAFSSIKSLRESLAAAQGVLEAAKRSEEKDGSGIVVLQREAGESGIGLLELRRIFGEKDSGNGKKLSGKLAGRIMNDKEMDEVLSGWSSIYPRVRIEPRTNQRELRITYKGLMKVFLELHHSPTEIQVERILCHGLKEKVRLDPLHHIGS